ncbi:GGDEF domain-containing protein [Paenibacillus polygoni]|uniref:GGDEF domain-containing protein n=1 Tax=Paenibacillus polygoni TaxID=3050112 RepID=A0ABY8X1T6_9BACL|nr:GGDEF domain-containing protein [Paenibacillus polygoni]WIV17200.1 GGDEF domain-containing protein [Paenibacillus polygoni]
MINEQGLFDDVGKWQRKILNGYWIVVLISFVAEIVALIIKMKLEPERVQHYLIYKMMIPTSVQVTLVTVNELIERYYRKSFPLLTILTGTLIGAVLIYGNMRVIGIQYVMMIPMLVAAFHFTKKYLTFAFLMVIAELAILYIMFPLIWTHMTIFERFALFYILTGEYLILIQLLHRGNDLLERLVRTSRSERDLLINNTIMERLSKTDALTDLYNHRTFQEYLDHLIEHCDTNKIPLQMAVIDIDNFKSINDTYGHAVGDIILKRVAGILQQSLTSDEIIARYGGEEFAIIFPEKTLDQAFEICERARESIYLLNHLEMENRRVTVSIGLSGYVHGMDKSQFFREVDSLLYTAKKEGKNRTVYPHDIEQSVPFSGHRGF